METTKQPYRSYHVRRWDGADYGAVLASTQTEALYLALVPGDDRVAYDPTSDMLTSPCDDDGAPLVTPGSWCVTPVA